MKNQMYIALLALPLLAGCGNKKETSHAMPVPEIQVCKTLRLPKTIPAI